MAIRKREPMSEGKKNIILLPQLNLATIHKAA